MPKPFPRGSHSPAAPASTPHSRATSPPPPSSAQLRRPASHSRLTKLLVPGRSRSSSTVSQEATTGASPITVTAHGEDGVASGRTTPEQRRRTARAAAQSLLASDGKYKKYASQVDRALQSFENVNEWADFISFLSRLLKTLQTPSPPYSEIPRKVIVSKRLAQCLNPALPSGVHTRALDVYGHVFSIIGTEGLKRDLLIWSSGLFPFFQYASTSVRPALINLYETYYLPLGEDLRPATKALILALLPGIEEETGDFFDQVLSLLTRLSEEVSSSFFLQNVFLVLISSPASRLAALNYLARKLTEPPEDLTSDAGLLIRGVAAVLGDDNMLVRRGGLDLLLRILPLNGTLLAGALASDRTYLVRAVAAVVLQRDVSLSRRVYTWFLGTDEQPQQQTSYFKENGLDLLANTLQEGMDKLPTATDMAEAQVPFKVFLSLLDKWELGEALSERLAISSLQAIHAAADTHSSEVISTAEAVYGAIEPTVLWKQLRSAVDEDRSDAGTKHLGLILWLLNSVSAQDDETLNIHLPLLLAKLLHSVEDNNLPKPVLTASLQVSKALLATIPASVFSGSAPATANGESGEDASAEQLAYSDAMNEQAATKKVHDEVAPNIVTTVFTLSQSALKAGWAPDHVLLLLGLVNAMIDREIPPLSLVNGPKWTADALRCLEKVPSFAVVDALVDAVLKASRSSVFKPAIDVTSDAVMTKVLDSLFRYLRRDAAPYHARAAELLWEYNQLAEIHTLESVISRRMSSLTTRHEALEAFGVLWRQSDDSMLPGEIFRVPMCMVLDGLQSDDPQVLRSSETWMRCNLRSYFRMLDPLLRRTMETAADGGKTRSGDASLINYFVSGMTSLFRFGGQGLSKACQSTEVRKSPNAQFVTRVENTYPGAHTYLELLTELLTTLLDEGPNQQLTLRVQSSSLELLQLLVSRGDLSPKSLTHIKRAIVEKLNIATKHRSLTLQNTMLHLLHSTISAPGTTERRRGHRVTSSSFSIPEKPRPSEEAANEFDQALVKMVLVGVSSPGNRPILQHWVDFVLMTIPHLEHRQIQLRTLCDCFCEQLRMTMIQLRNTFSVVSIIDQPAMTTEAEPIMLLSVVERLASVLGAKLGLRSSEDKDRANHEGGGLLGYLPTVFSVEAPTDVASKVEASRYLDDIVEALLVTWAVTEEPVVDHSDPSLASRAQIMSRTRVRARKALEKMFKAQPSEIMGSCVQVWATKSSDISDSAIFNCIDTLAPTTKVVDLICEHMNGKGRGSVSDSSNPALASFLEVYISRLEGPIAVQVWNAQYSYAREVLGQANTPAGRMLLFPMLRCLTALGQIVSTTSALEDRRLRRDLQDTYAKLLDAVLSNSSRIGESALWDREKGLGAIDEDTAPTTASGVQKIYAYVCNHVMQNLRTFLVDNDRVASACHSVSSTIIAPAFKQQRVDATVLRLLRELTRIPVAVKSWRVPVGDAFNDNRFFRIRPDDSGQWKPLVCALMDTDKERFGDLLGRIAAAPSANIFTNREAEMVSRSLNLRRLSFVLLAAERNHYLAQLPLIQEKLVEILRTNVVSPRVHYEVYLCLRVLMCRISPQHLANFWPVILAELFRVFEATMDEPPEDGDEHLLLVLAACKFLDLLLVIQSEDFQIHQWIFVTDTTDASHPPEDYSPEALVDRLGEILADHTDATKLADSIIIAPPDTGLRRPHLSNLKTLASLHQLQPFFARASIDTFEGVYADAGVDWDAIEEGFIGEIFEGE